MSETLLKELKSDQQRMTANAMLTVLIIGLCIHILLNVFAYVNKDPILKIEMPVLSAVSVLAIFLGVKMTKH
jgi:uncharacterized integral membrane protein